MLGDNTNNLLTEKAGQTNLQNRADVESKRHPMKDVDKPTPESQVRHEMTVELKMLSLGISGYNLGEFLKVLESYSGHIAERDVGDEGIRLTVKIPSKNRDGYSFFQTFLYKGDREYEDFYKKMYAQEKAKTSPLFDGQYRPPSVSPDKKNKILEILSKVHFDSMLEQGYEKTWNDDEGYRRTDQYYFDTKTHKLKYIYKISGYVGDLPIRKDFRRISEIGPDGVAFHTRIENQIYGSHYEDVTEIWIDEKGNTIRYEKNIPHWSEARQKHKLYPGSEFWYYNNQELISSSQIPLKSKIDVILQRMYADEHIKKEWENN